MNQVNTIQHHKIGRAETHNYVYQQNYHQPQRHTNQQFNHDAQIQSMPDNQMQNSSQESLKQNVPVHQVQNQCQLKHNRQPPNYLHQMKNYPTNTCIPVNYQQPVVKSANQLPTQSMEHQNIHRAEATCDSRNINKQTISRTTTIQSEQSQTNPLKYNFSSRKKASHTKKNGKKISQNRRQCEKQYTSIIYFFLEMRRTSRYLQI
ncbi:unnamed protein product [Mytilus coruscus]|uniref:Uncharacterized protein n=1 Tax=Mytilus coruscus TaxID=42192 RepID=A0A6J8CUM7_MYTCO|nr:unnamed protein product [Mytilus coruscus]